MGEVRNLMVSLFLVCPVESVVYRVYAGELLGFLDPFDCLDSFDAISMLVHPILESVGWYGPGGFC